MQCAFTFIFTAAQRYRKLCLIYAHAFASFMVNKVSDIRANIPQSDLNPCTSLPLQCNWSVFSLVSLSDISALLATMTPSSSPLDILPTTMFLKTFGSIGPCIVEIINQSLQTGVIPAFFKQAAVEPKLKKSNLDPANLKNYRPISKLPFLAKILEKVVAEQLNAFVDENSFFDTFQSGFRKKTLH